MWNVGYLRLEWQDWQLGEHSERLGCCLIETEKAVTEMNDWVEFVLESQNETEYLYLRSIILKHMEKLQ